MFFAVYRHECEPDVWAEIAEPEAVAVVYYDDGECILCERLILGA